MNNLVLENAAVMEDLLVPVVLPLGWFYLVTLSFATALDRPLECLHSFMWFDSPVKDKTSRALQRPSKWRISAEKMQKYGTWLLQELVCDPRCVNSLPSEQGHWHPRALAAAGRLGWLVKVTQACDQHCSAVPEEGVYCVC